MKKLLCLLLALTLLLSGCVSTPGKETEPTATEAPNPIPQDTEPTGVPTEDPTQEPTEEVLPTDPALDELRENLPLMDGSTSLIPMEAGIRAALFGKTIEEATLDVAHSSTWGSFWNLLSGSVDMIFSCPLSQEQWDRAKEEKVALEAVPIAKEGFIFVVNAENPVTVFTDPATPGITNWSQVGGLDEEIIPYQRNNDSGSQNYMKVFMGDTPLMDAPLERRPASMEGLMDVVAINENARGAIGYSVYAYAADMYGNGNEIKFIAVDGVAPSKATMASGEYPLLGENFAVFHADEPEDSYVRQLVDWILSYPGQLALAKAGYVTMENLGFDYKEMTLSKYQGVGSGPAAQGYDSIGYTTYTVVPTEWGDTERDILLADVVTLDDGSQTYRVSGLANEALMQEINDFIDLQMNTWARTEAQKAAELVDRLNSGQEFGPYSAEYWAWDSQTDLGVAIQITCDNGYLSVAISTGYQYAVGDGACRYTRTETATWDIFTGKRLSMEDLFAEGTDIDQVLNDFLRWKVQDPRSGFELYYYDMVNDFAALPTTGWHMTHDAIYFDAMNPYFAYGVRFDLNEMGQEVLVSGIARDFSACFAEPKLECRQTLRIDPLRVDYEYLNDEFLSWGYLDEDAYPMGKKINDQVRNYITTYYREDVIRDFFKVNVPTVTDPDIYWMDWNVYGFGHRYVLFNGNCPYAFEPTTEVFHYYNQTAMLLFDLETGEEADWRSLLKPGWESACTVEDNALETVALPENYGTMTLHHMGLYDRDCLYIQLLDGLDVYCLEIPLDYVNL